MTTCEPLTLFDMPDESGLLPAASLASQPVAPGSKEAAQMTAGSGLTLYESFPKSGPLGRCLKTLLASETWASPEFFLTWKVSGTKCGSSVFRLVPSAHRTAGNGTGSSDTEASAWPTPAARDIKGQTQNPERMDYVPNIIKATAWPTPDANMGEGGRQSSTPGATYRENGTKRQVTLNELTTWPTQQGYDGSRGGPQSIEKRKAGGHGQTTGDYLSDTGPTPSTSLALTASFVVRLTTLSAWLMGYTAQYLALWETASSRKSRRASSPP